MKLIKCAVLIIYGLGLMLVSADKGITQNVNNAEKNRVIFEQPMSYDDALKMKIKVEQLEKEQNENNSGDTNLLLDAVGNNSDQNPDMLIMMKALLKAMGIDELPEDNKASEEDQQQSKDKNNFQQWEGRHNWKGLSTEQR